MAFWNRKEYEYPDWPIRDEDFLEDDLDNYRQDPYLLVTLTEASRLIDPQWRNQAFIAGGFPANLAGITTEFGDCDIFCVTEDAFENLKLKVHNGSQKEFTDRAGKREFLDVNETPYGKVMKFMFRGIKFDLVDFADRINTATAKGILVEFDISWSMAVISLGDRKLTIHKDALSSTPRVSSLRADIYLEGTLRRLPKYQDRLFRTPDVKECDRLIQITKNRLDRQTRDERRKQRSFY